MKISKTNDQILASCCVNIVTLLAVAFISGCAYINDRIGESCKNHAYIKTVVSDYISNRFPSDAHVRLGIIPFSTPANLTSINNELPGIDEQLAWKIQGVLLDYQEIPIVEVLPRSDWPGKKDEFFKGNFGAISQARDAGYDLVMVGFLEPIKQPDQLVVYSKIMDTDSGVTIWYGKSTIISRRDDLQSLSAALPFVDREPNPVYLGSMVDDIARCIGRGAMSDKDK